MYYHIMVKSQAGEEAFDFDKKLSEEEVIENYIKPYIENEKVIVKNLILTRDEIKEMSIKKTDISLEELKIQNENINKINKKNYEIKYKDYKKRGLFYDNVTPPEKPQIYLFDKSHYLNKLPDNLLIELKKKYEEKHRKLNNQNINQTNLKNKKIFISHSSKDEKYALELVNLLEAIGVEKVDIVCTTISGTRLKIGSDDYLEEIKRYIQESPIFICLFSENYLKSNMCMCEMGAGWITKNKKIVILIAETNFNRLENTVLSKSHGMKIEDENEVGELLELIEEELRIESIKYTQKKNKIESFIRNIKEIKDSYNKKSFSTKKSLSDIKNDLFQTSKNNNVGEILAQNNRSIYKMIDLEEEVTKAINMGIPRHAIAMSLAKKYNISPGEVESYFDEY